MEELNFFSTLIVGISIKTSITKKLLFCGQPTNRGGTRKALRARVLRIKKLCRNSISGYTIFQGPGCPSGYDAGLTGSIPVTTEFILIACDSNQVPKCFGTHYNLEVPL